MNFFEYLNTFQGVPGMFRGMANLYPCSLYQIVATDEQWGIAKNGELPWDEERDHMWFREETMDSAVVVGRKTYEKMPTILDGRMTFVLTSNVDTSEYISRKHPDQYHPYDATMQVESWFDCLKELFYWMSMVDGDEPSVYFAGGRSVYRQTLRYCDGVYHTLFNDDYNCDIQYPCSERLEENFTYDLPLVDFGNFERRFYEPVHSSPEQRFFS